MLLRINVCKSLKREKSHFFKWSFPAEFGLFTLQIKKIIKWDKVAFIRSRFISLDYP